MDLQITNKNAVYDENVREFALSVAQLQIEEFMGVARLLNIEIINKDFDEEKEVGDDNLRLRDFYTVLTEMITEYCSMERNKRRKLLRIIKSAIKENTNPLQ